MPVSSPSYSDILSVVVLEESPCPRKFPRINLQVFVLVLILQVLVLVGCPRSQVLFLVLEPSLSLSSDFKSLTASLNIFHPLLSLASLSAAGIDSTITTSQSFCFPDLRREGHYEMMAGVCLSVCRVPRPNSRTERPRKPKIDRMKAHHTANP